MEVKKVVVTEKLHEHGQALLMARKDLNVVYADGDKSRVLTEIPDAHAILVRTLMLTAEDLSAAPSLEVVSRHGVGCDNIDVSTRGLIGAKEFAALPSHAIVINCARGGVIDEHALIDAVRNRKIAATGADVFAVEPPAPDHPLLTLPHSVLTPHNAAGTAESLSRMATFAAQNILDVFDGVLTRERLINPEVLG